MNGHGTRRFLIPDIGIRATQSHAREDVGPDVLWVSQERLRCDEKYYDRLPRFYVHGATLADWSEIVSATRSPTPSGPHKSQETCIGSFGGQSHKRHWRNCIWLQSWLTHLHII